MRPDVAIFFEFVRRKLFCLAFSEHETADRPPEQPTIEMGENMTSMTKIIPGLAIVIAGSAMLVASVAMARGPGGEINFAEIDADSNGEISIQEFQDHKLNRIKAIDTNGDGILSEEELMAAHDRQNAKRTAKRLQKLMERADANEDGQLSVEELAAMSGKRGGGDNGFPRGLDANEDGVVTEEELSAAMEKRGDRRGKGKDKDGDSDS